MEDVDSHPGAVRDSCSCSCFYFYEIALAGISHLMVAVALIRVAVGLKIFVGAYLVFVPVDLAWVAVVTDPDPGIAKDRLVACSGFYSCSCFSFSCNPAVRYRQ